MLAEEYEHAFNEKGTFMYFVFPQQLRSFLFILILIRESGMLKYGLPTFFVTDVYLIER